jgi:hypothetical protein
MQNMVARPDCAAGSGRRIGIEIAAREPIEQEAGRAHLTCGVKKNANMPANRADPPFFPHISSRGM